jgi:DNA-directed RNA polymerase specialized sigma24 family protein
MLSFEEEVDALVTAELLTEQQARAFVHREIELTPRQAAADAMDVSPNRLDNLRARAVELVEQAHETSAAVESIRNQLPDDDP